MASPDSQKDLRIISRSLSLIFLQSFLQVSLHLFPIFLSRLHPFSSPFLDFHVNFFPVFTAFFLRLACQFSSFLFLFLFGNGVANDASVPNSEKGFLLNRLSFYIIAASLTWISGSNFFHLLASFITLLMKIVYVSHLNVGHVPVPDCLDTRL